MSLPKTFFPRKKETLMKHIPMTLLRAFCGATLLLMAAHSQQMRAQTPTPTPQSASAPEFLAITMVSVKGEMRLEFQNFMKNTTIPALKKGGLKWREVWQTTGAAGDAFEYVIVSPVAKFAEFDGPSALEKGLGPQGLPAWQTKAGDRKSTRLNSSHSQISYAVFCLKKKKKNKQIREIIE